jgi:hypothetical protein
VLVEMGGVFGEHALVFSVLDESGETVYRRFSASVGPAEVPQATWSVIHELTHLFQTPGAYSLEVRLAGGEVLARLPLVVARAGTGPMN